MNSRVPRRTNERKTRQRLLLSRPGLRQAQLHRANRRTTLRQDLLDRPGLNRPGYLQILAPRIQP
jgi:hypothetical protein